MLNEHFEKTKEKLDKVGKGFCLAKWTQVTLQLQTGHNHSCHHPVTHKISELEVAQNPSALHNTNYKKNRRREMMEGLRPKECDYCWNIEDNSNEFSDRVYKSTEPWSMQYFDEVLKTKGEKDINPKYVEVSFSNVCNFKCSYCGPAFSSQWMEEIQQHGSYPTSTNFNNLDYLKSTDQMPIPHNKKNPYVDAFWKWWPDLYKDLHTFRITGGEPLLAKDTFDVLDFINNEPNPNTKLNLSINTNLSAPEKIFNEFRGKITKLMNEEKVNEFILFTSCDAYGEHANYIRHGFNYDLFIERINILLTENPKLTIIIMSTYNALSVPSYKGLIKDVYELKKKYHSAERYYGSSVILDSSYLRWPPHQSVKILDKEWIDEVNSQAQLMDFYEQVRVGDDGYGFTDIEITKVKRIAEWMKNHDDDSTFLKNRKDFFIFVRHHDMRRGTNFLEIFPEFDELYKKCRKGKV
jgi:organic radical activating enzyme